ncbi:uncharacterized protein LOC118414235 [Branchiostoma floridae]|uniref:Uncharacterized protein LOC118414235 n=1 Tax=Branchiostoma floridae TaxID=7739 RepID=A0A9J7MP95_BRAFL|nr:uncharacterized protein LOC118414235 [Branchiostoma floridae]
MSFRHIATLAVLLAVVIAAEGRPKADDDFAAAKKRAAKAESDQLSKANELPKVAPAEYEKVVNKEARVGIDQAGSRGIVFIPDYSDSIGSEARANTDEISQVRDKLYEQAVKDFKEQQAAEMTALVEDPHRQFVRDMLYSQAVEGFEAQLAAKMTARVEDLERQFDRAELYLLAGEPFKVLAAETAARVEEMERYPSVRDELYKQAGKDFKELEASKMTARVEDPDRQFVRDMLYRQAVGEFAAEMAAQVIEARELSKAGEVLMARALSHDIAVRLWKHSPLKMPGLIGAREVSKGDEFLKARALSHVRSELPHLAEDDYKRKEQEVADKPEARSIDYEE